MYSIYSIYNYSIYIVYIYMYISCVHKYIYIMCIIYIYVWKPPANEVNMGIHYGYCNVINDDISMII